MWEAVLPRRLLRGMELQGTTKEEGVGEAEAVGGALAEVEAEKSKAEVTFGPTSCRAKFGKKVLWSLEEETSCIKDLWQLPIIPWNGKTPTAATAAATKATAGGDATAPTDGVLEAVKKVQQQQTHDEVQQPSRQVEVVVSEEEMSGVTEEGGAAEVEQQQQQQHESPPRVPHPPERSRRDVRPPVRLTYGGRGKPNVVQAGSVVEQIEEDEIAHCYWAPIPEPKTREEALNGPNGEKWKASEDEEFGSLIENETWDLCDLPPGKKAITSKMIYRHKPKWHWVRRLLDKEVRLEIVKTHQQAADIFTKRLAEADHWKGMKLAGMSVH
ncbi:hypothetical protein CLOP_g9125 [Closterium sp. NIES-67]|nr:hypothetical protein CLOP_g9125 [Closterium sp. NIES-67]